MKSEHPDFRRLQVTNAGMWYVALTIAAGVVALVSGNNVLYLIESLLLSGLILSGVVSERTVSALEVRIKRLPATAGQNSHDRVTVRNTKGFSLFCVEVGEWRNGKLESLAFFPRLGPGAEVNVASGQRFEKRGTHRWEGLAIATSYPFGFARKVKVIRQPGERLIWPARLPQKRASETESLHQNRKLRFGGEISEGEVRPMNHDDDYRAVVWTLSARGSDPMIRMRRKPEKNSDVTLDLRCAPGEGFEKRVSLAGDAFHGEEAEGTLTLLLRKGRKTLRGKNRVLNELAVIEPEGGGSSECA